MVRISGFHPSDLDSSPNYGTACCEMCGISSAGTWSLLVMIIGVVFWFLASAGSLWAIVRKALAGLVAFWFTLVGDHSVQLGERPDVPTSSSPLLATTCIIDPPWVICSFEDWSSNIPQVVQETSLQVLLFPFSPDRSSQQPKPMQNTRSSCGCRRALTAKLADFIRLSEKILHCNPHGSSLFPTHFWFGSPNQPSPTSCHQFTPTLPSPSPFFI